MYSAAPLPPELQGRSFTVRESADSGVGTSRTRARDLATPSREIRIPRGTIQPLLQRCRPYTDLTSGSFVSHSSAALIHGIPLPEALEQEEVLHLSRIRTDAVPRRRNVVGHRLDIGRDDVVVLAGVPVTSPERTWLDLATILTDVDQVIAGDYLVSEHQRSYGVPRHPIVSKAELGEFLAAHSGSRGIKRARWAYERLRIGVDSPPETRVRLILQDAGLPVLTVNHPVLNKTGGVAFWTDLACAEFTTCIEYDGEHHLTPEQQRRDMNRDALAVELGWIQVKLNRLDLRQGGWWVEKKVRAALLRRGWREETSRTFRDLERGKPA